MSLDKIKAPVNKYVDSYNQKTKEVLSSKSEILASAIEKLERNSGKQIRSIITMLIASLFDDKLREETIDAAVSLELIHSATLIHDDVIDEAKTRRGEPSLNSIFDNRISVLIGDFIFSSALIGAIACKDLRVIALISEAGKDLSEGEILQYETATSALINEDRYLEVINQKTATLFRSSALLACYTSKVSDKECSIMAEFGENLGMAFQIRDDIFDYYKGDVGKPTGNDIREGKVTLPLIYALSKKESSEKQKARIDIIKSQDYSTQNIATLIEFAKEEGGIDYANNVMQNYIQKAKDILVDNFEDSIYRRSLIELCEYIGGRDK